MNRSFAYLFHPGMLVLISISAYSLARRVTATLEEQGKPWAILGGITVFILSFCVFFCGTELAFGVSFGR